MLGENSLLGNNKKNSKEGNGLVVDSCFAMFRLDYNLEICILDKFPIFNFIDELVDPFTELFVMI